MHYLTERSFVRRFVLAISAAVMASLSVAQSTNNAPLRKAALEVYAGYATAQLLRQIADECAPERREGHSKAFVAWEMNHKLRGFDTLLTQQLSTPERAQLEQQAQSQLVPQLKNKFPNCVSTQLNALYESDSMNPGKGSRGASLSLVQTALAGGVVTTSPQAPNVAPPAAAQAPNNNNNNAGLAALEGVYLNQSTGFGVGGMMTIEFDAYAVFKDGSITSDITVLGGQSDARNSKKWGRWQRAGNGFSVTWNSGKTSNLSGSTFYKTFPANAGETLSGMYRSVGGGGNTALGGNTMVVDASNLTFFPDGRFEASSAKGGSAPGVATSARSASSGTYRLDGHTIEMRYGDGRVVKTGFYFYPAKGLKETKAIGIGNRDYSKR